MIVFDKRALIAYLRRETGGDMVRDLLDEADVEKVAHAVNLCEVLSKLSLLSDEPTAFAALADLRIAGIVERSDMDALLWQDAGRLVARQRKAGHGLSLGDSFGLALARRLGADFVTSDRAEFAPIQAAGLASVTFIR